MGDGGSVHLIAEPEMYLGTSLFSKEYKTVQGLLQEGYLIFR
jgi:hypothetical protein